MKKTSVEVKSPRRCCLIHSRAEDSSGEAVGVAISVTPKNEKKYGYCGSGGEKELSLLLKQLMQKLNIKWE